jgi:hypothetical protein
VAIFNLDISFHLLLLELNKQLAWSIDGTGNLNSCPGAIRVLAKGPGIGFLLVLAISIRNVWKEAIRICDGLLNMHVFRLVVHLNRKRGRQ